MPKVHIGERTRITCGREETYSYPWTVTAWKEFPFTPGETLKNSISSFTQNTIFGDRMVHDIATGSHSPGGSIPFEFMSRGQLTAMQYLLGGASDITAHSTDANAKVRVLYGSIDEASFPSAEAGYQVGGLTFRKWFLTENTSSDESANPDSFMIEYTGSKINSFNLSIPQDGYVTGSIDVLATREAVHDYYPGEGTSWDTGYLLSSGTEINSPTGDYVSSFTSPDSDRAITSVRLANDGGFSGYVQFGDVGSAAAIATVQSADFTISNNAERVQVVGQTESYSIEMGRRIISGNMTVVLDGLDFYNYFLNETDKELHLKFDARRTGATNEYIEFVFPRIRVGGDGAEAPTPMVTGSGPLSLTVPFQALRYDSLITTSVESIAIPEYTDVYVIVMLDGGSSAVADSEFYF